MIAWGIWTFAEIVFALLAVGPDTCPLQGEDNGSQ